MKQYALIGWTIVLSLFFMFVLSAYLTEFGFFFRDTANWQYYNGKCSLHCADMGCIHGTRFPVLYKLLVQTQVDWLKQTHTYKTANLILYIISLPVLYSSFIVHIARHQVVKLSNWWFLPAGAGCLVAILDFIETALTPLYQQMLYWGGVAWSVYYANKYHVTLMDIYLLVFGILLPLSVIAILAYFVLSPLCSDKFKPVHRSY